MGLMERTPVAILGVIFILLGILGFVSNPLIGANALFAAGIVHNLFHLTAGGILLAVSLRPSRNIILWLRLIGSGFFLLGLLGFLLVSPEGKSFLGLIETNDHTSWLHLIAGVILFVSTLSDSAFAQTERSAYPRR